MKKIPQTPPAPSINAWWLLCLTWFIVLVASLGAIFIGEILGKMPCTLCWYQRISMFPLVIILGIGCYKSDYKAASYALPLALIGMTFALYHSLLYAGVITLKIVPCASDIPCGGSGMTLYDVIALPYLSLFCFTVISITLTIFMRKNVS
ncbi:MAG: disulfide bond formation protein B [Oceanospirillaceae bacterium]